ncbi:hypothetical protein BDF14DRAFT_1885880 [Spinellus fusiger]|nr:hypothetical protein BDF14DRAFT_1885880 [Spinellus fusiger]
MIIKAEPHSTSHEVFSSDLMYMTQSLPDIISTQICNSPKLDLFYKVLMGEHENNTHSHETPFQYYAFIGSHILDTSISLYLGRNFSTIEPLYLERMFVIIKSTHQLCLLICRKFRLIKYCSNKQSMSSTETIIHTFIGILFELHGLPIVNAWMTPLLDEVCPSLLHSLPRTVYRSIYRLPAPPPLPASGSITQQFLDLIHAYCGSHDFQYASSPSQGPGGSKWSVDVVYHLAPTAAWFTHTRTGQSKKEARFLAMHDIVNYYNCHEELKISHQHATSLSHESSPPATPLPIAIDNYSNDYVLLDNSPQPTAQTEAPVKRKGYIVHEPDQDDAALMACLLGQVTLLKVKDEVPNKKKQRIQTPPSSLMSPAHHALSAAALPECIYPEVVRSPEDLQSVDRIRHLVHSNVSLRQFIEDPQRQLTPKGCIQKILATFSEADFNTLYESSGPMHSVVFDAKCVLQFGNESIVTMARASKKGKAETGAIYCLLKLLI